MQNIIARLRESPSSEEDNYEMVPETGKSQSKYSHGDQLERHIERQPAERRAPAIVESALVADAPVGGDTPQSLGESRQELSPAWIATDEARQQLKETTQTESAQRSVEKSEDSFTRTRAAGNFFSDEDDDDDDDDDNNNSPNEGRSLEPPAGPADPSTPAHTRYASYQQPSTKDQQKSAKRDTQIDVDDLASDNINELVHQPPPHVPPTNLVPDNETGDSHLRIHNGRSNDRRRNAANQIRQQRSPGTPIFHK
ncbi:hypothetical protein PISL3812_06920 [Talaromyces islandicus]|uniref:Uncharacterized protein n=1 Tax=Talaromyces islandicus TaxID=28573 RepID=A0A0U1M4D4_TALIS|nr:hypothetical protein PISL3812_06920 [Talaromyces islandicus]